MQSNKNNRTSLSGNRKVNLTRINNDSEIEQSFKQNEISCKNTSSFERRSIGVKDRYSMSQKEADEESYHAELYSKPTSNKNSNAGTKSFQQDVSS